MSNFFLSNRLVQTLILVGVVGFPLKGLSSSVEIHTIYDIKGIVFVQKKGWKKPQSASVGLTLISEDRLEIKANSLVKIYCSDTTKTLERKTGIYQVSSICPSGKSVIRLPNSNNDTLRNYGQTEEALAKLPYLITPRNSFILTNTPLLRWNPVQGARNYTVKIDGINWETQTNKTEINYSGKIPLEAGQSYGVTIKADNGKSSESDGDTVWFILLDEAEQKTVLEAKKTIEQQSLSSEAKGLILAQLYRGYKLYADAILVLEDLVKKGSQTVAIYQLLGDIYLETGLPQLAQKPYEKALKLITTKENLSVQADIQKGLGKAYYGLGNENEALQWLKKAEANYQELGDSLQVQELDTIINSISGS
jgi:hypothetical protein